MSNDKALVYAPLKELSDSEIFEILEQGDINELLTLPLSVGEYHADWKFAQNLCAKLTEHQDANIRANAILGFAYIARTKGVLDRNIVLPIILKELEENNNHSGIINDALDDINIFLKWNILK